MRGDERRGDKGDKGDKERVEVTVTVSRGRTVDSK